MDLLILTSHPDPGTVLPSLALLAHSVRSAPADVSALLTTESAQAVLVDARTDLAAARNLCRLLASTATVPVVAVLTEGGLIAINAEWSLDDFLVADIGPAELDARLRMLTARRVAPRQEEESATLSLGAVTIDEETYTARLRGRPMDLTYKEFELLKYLVAHVGRVFTRAQLLHEVWGYDYFGGTRTVDVHVRRLRAKLGPDHEALIGTVRNVGYKAVAPSRRAADAESDGEILEV
ncbi:response regulator transcription factor [Gordonia sp. X0973]|uniref:response regulator transcription factor n=1 Tax=Gordonia sp. X0973 TaxID=2742602 RepID=UPI000F54A729|nr:response regulator transcription factor [Gordonia sp. X0973]QKT06331.1 response regulator transcription factor [Gordonia sp. X0973]